MLANGREDDNVAKDNPRLTVRVHYSLWDPEFSYGYLGTYLGMKKVLTIGVAYDMQPDVACSNLVQRTGLKDYKAWTVVPSWNTRQPAGSIRLLRHSSSTTW